MELFVVTTLRACSVIAPLVLLWRKLRARRGVPPVRWDVARATHYLFLLHVGLRLCGALIDDEYARAVDTIVFLPAGLNLAQTPLIGVASFASYLGYVVVRSTYTNLIVRETLVLACDLVATLAHTYSVV